MGLHTIQFTWNITIREPHKIKVTRIGHHLTDTLEIALDDSKIASPTVFVWTGLGFGIGRQDLAVEDRLMEIRWKYGAEDPKSIVLIDEGKIIAQYGDNRAAKSVPTSNSISHENMIPIIGPEGLAYVGYVGWHPIQKWFFRVSNQFGSPTLPPISTKTQSEIDLGTLGREIGFQDEALIQRLGVHSKRLKNWRTRLAWSAFLLSLLLGMVLWSLFPALLMYLDTRDPIFILVPSCILGVILGSIALRLAQAWASRGEAETLAVTSMLYILAELKEEDALIHPDKKQVLLARFSYLARQTRQLGRRYLATNLNNQKWVETHFKKIEAEVRERERWVYAPIASTLPDLRSYLYQLAPIYITGLYGEFTYQPGPEVLETKEPSNQPGFSRWLPALLPKLLLFGLGVVLPGIILSRLPAELAEGQQRLAGFDLPLARSVLVSVALGCLGRLFNIDVAGLATPTDEPAQA